MIHGSSSSSPLSQAPEALHPKTKLFSKASDVWAFGVVIWVHNYYEFQPSSLATISCVQLYICLFVCLFLFIHLFITLFACTYDRKCWLMEKSPSRTWRPLMPEWYPYMLYSFACLVWFGLLWRLTWRVGVDRSILLDQAVLMGERLRTPDHCPEPLVVLMHDCWHTLPEQRPSFEAIYQRLNCIALDHKAGQLK